MPGGGAKVLRAGVEEMSMNNIKYTENGQTDGAAAIWFERKGRIYIQIEEESFGSMTVERIIRKTGCFAVQCHRFPVNELRRIKPLSLRGLGSAGAKIGDTPEPILGKAEDF